jgi:hypothetical protein
MEAHLGRQLTADEVVHHRDGNTQNNQIDNLELFATNAAHLATTLTGSVQNPAKNGRPVRRAFFRQQRKLLRASTPQASVPNGQELPDTNGQNES